MSKAKSNSSTAGWYFGWNIVAVATLMVLLTVGLRLGMGPFFFPISADLGFSRSLLSGMVAIAMLSYGAVMPFAGWVVERIGTCTTILVGTVLIAVGAVWTVNTHTTVGFALAFGVVLSVGLALISPVTLTPIVTRWFKLKRGMALFFLSTGGMAGLAVATPFLSWAIARFGWQSTMVGYALLLIVLAIPGALFIMRDDAPEQADQGARISAKTDAVVNQVSLLDIGQALKTLPFWLLTLGLMANGFSMTLLGTHGVPMLIDHGFSASTSALGIGAIGFVAIAGTIMLGHMADRVSRRNMLSLIYCVRGVAFIGLLMVISGWQLYAVAIVGGLVWAGAMALASALLADIYGVQLLGLLYGIAYAFQQLAGMVSAWLGGWGFDVYHTHWLAFGSAAAILFIGAVATLLLPHSGFSYTRNQAPR